jgi:3-phosphoshikimate 1-carboxyvinyltransferase
VILRPLKLEGKLVVPASKSDTQRAVLAAGLADGLSVLEGVGSSEDEKQMLQNIEVIGAVWKQENTQTNVSGAKGFPDSAEFDLGESGLGFRLIAGQCAVHEGDFLLNAKGTLVQRPMTFYQEQFTGSGKIVQGEFAPLRMTGHSNKFEFEIDGSNGSQFLSGLLMALPLAKQDSIVQVNNLKSRPYVDMTLDTLKKFKIQINEAQTNLFTIPGNQKYSPTTYRIEADWSSASCWLSAAALGHKIQISGLNRNSLQADKGMLQALEKANCQVDFQNDIIRVDGSRKRAFRFDANDCPDLFPALAVLAASIEGTTEILGLNRLKVKESDRGLALQQELSKMGVLVELRPEIDTMFITGTENLKTGEFDAHHDHRIAMCIGVLSTVLPGESTLNGAESVGKSYPDFWKHLKQLSS